MQKRSLDDLPQLVREQLPTGASGKLLVAFSGGLDSTVLLHALARGASHVRAVHIDHGLHSNASMWAAECTQVARVLEVELSVRSVTVPLDADEGLESAARRIRYEVLRQLLEPGETLVTAHHADDQLETVLLALMRGSGVDGLAAMPRCQRFGAGWHLRSLLEFTRAELIRWARAHALTWLEDPSNENNRFDRNYLRNEVVPRLRRRWPSVARSATRTASHLGEATGLLDEFAAHDFTSARVGPCLRVSALRALSMSRRRNLLRYWLSSCGARAPSTRKLMALEHDMLESDVDRVPCVGWDEVEVRRHRDLLYCMSQRANAPLNAEWEWRKALDLSGALGILRAEIAHGAGVRRALLPDRLSIRWRAGGERLQLPGHAHHRALKKLLQEASVLPWWRDRLPLLYIDDRLIAVADLWIDASVAASAGDAGVRFIWQGRPQLHAVE